MFLKAEAKKARKRVDAIRRMPRSLDSENMLKMYSAFVRPILEYGSTLFMGAKPTHLEKLDRVQATMERMGGFKAQPLADRSVRITVICHDTRLSGFGLEARIEDQKLKQESKTRN